MPLFVGIRRKSMARIDGVETIEEVVKAKMHRISPERGKVDRASITGHELKDKRVINCTWLIGLP